MKNLRKNKAHFEFNSTPYAAFNTTFNNFKNIRNKNINIYK